VIESGIFLIVRYRKCHLIFPVRNPAWPKLPIFDHLHNLLLHRAGKGLYGPAAHTRWDGGAAVDPAAAMS